MDCRLGGVAKGLRPRGLENPQGLSGPIRSGEGAGSKGGEGGWLKSAAWLLGCGVLSWLSTC